MNSLCPTVNSYELNTLCGYIVKTKIKNGTLTTCDTRLRVFQNNLIIPNVITFYLAIKMPKKIRNSHWNKTSAQQKLTVETVKVIKDGNTTSYMPYLINKYN